MELVLALLASVVCMAALSVVLTTVSALIPSTVV
jgi:hypothetical protein